MYHNVNARHGSKLERIGCPGAFAQVTVQMRRTELAALRFKARNYPHAAEAAIIETGGTMVRVELGCALQAFPVKAGGQHKRLDNQSAPNVPAAYVASSHD